MDIWSTCVGLIVEIYLYVRVEDDVIRQMDRIIIYMRNLWLLGLLNRQDYSFYYPSVVKIDKISSNFFNL